MTLNWNKGLVAKIIVVVVLGLGWWYASVQTTSRPQSQPITNEGRNLPDFKAITSSYAVFYTSADLIDKTNTVVQFPYYFSTPHQPLFLNLQTNPGTDEVIVLVDHPIIEKVVDWPKIVSNDLVLYQRNQQFNSIENFISNHPKSEIIVADSTLIFNKKIKPDANILSLGEWTDDTNFDYFLTTYHEPIEKDYYNIAEFRVDASNGYLKDCGENKDDCHPTLTWKLDMPNSGDETLFLGEVHVDFRQSSK